MTVRPLSQVFSCRLSGRSAPGVRAAVSALAFLLPLAGEFGAAAQTSARPSDEARISDAAGSNDPLSLEAIQAGVQAFEKRRAAEGKPEALERKAPIERRAHDAVATDGKAGESAAEAPRKAPSQAKEHTGGGEGQTVESDRALTRTYNAAKKMPEPVAGFPVRGSAEPEPLAASARIAFAGSTTTPPPGIDPRLRSALTTRGGNRETYAFLLLDTPAGEGADRALAQAGVKPLGLHGGALKVRVPAEALDNLAKMSGLRSLAYPAPEQKIAPDLKEVTVRRSAEAPRFPIIVNLFEGDEKGAFAERLRATGAEVVRYDPGLTAYEMLASPEQIKALSNIDFVLFIEVEKRSGGGHDQSMATNGVDYIRNSGFLGGGMVVGLLDTGAMVGSAAATPHQDLNKFGCGINFTSDAAGVWNDQNGHGSHVLGTLSGTGTAQSRFRGVATAVGASERIRVGKIWDSTNHGQNAWLRDAIDYMADATSCNAPRPAVINLSGGAQGTGQTGTDAESRRLDDRVWETRQAYIVCSGNTGPNAQTIWSPGVAKNALTVGNVSDAGNMAVGELANGSSRGPTGDGRMKPNLVATGNVVTSVRAGTTNQYTDMSGCSMATPHVSGIAASLMEHYPDFRNRPHLLRAHLMATAVLHSDQATPDNNTNGGRNDYGLGRVSDYEAHWARFDPNGWDTHWAWMTITDKKWGFFDVDVPQGAKRLVVALTWDEPAASAGASQAVTYDIDLWADFGASCTPDPLGQCGNWASQSNIDNVEYLIINNPPAGKYRLKAINWRAPSSGLPVAIAANVIRGDPTPAISMTASPSTATPALGSTFTVTTRVANPAYVAYGVEVSAPTITPGLALLGVSTTREDGVAMDFPRANSLTLGTVTEADTRFATWTFRVNAGGPQTVRFTAWSNNGGAASQSVTVTP